MKSLEYLITHYTGKNNTHFNLKKGEN